MKNRYLAGFLTCYGFAGFLIGLAAKVAYPAMNVLGMFANAALWPLLPIGAIIDVDLMPSPQWMYSTQTEIVYVEGS